MAIVNKVTTIAPVNGAPVTDAIIQVHIDSMNGDGWSLVSVVSLIGWFKFFWSKEQV